jgi:hypothetical protein
VPAVLVHRGVSTNASPERPAWRLRVVRNFATYHQASDPRTEIPPAPPALFWGKSLQSFFRQRMITRCSRGRGSRGHSSGKDRLTNRKSVVPRRHCCVPYPAFLRLKRQEPGTTSR